MLVDSHCHLDFPDFADELDAVVHRAKSAGIGTLVTIGTKLSEAEKVIAIAERFPNVWATVGVHPHEAAVEPGEDTARLVELARHPKVVGIGETGLDYYYEHSPKDRQAACFRAHIKAARATGLPLIVHTRDADEDTAAILGEEMEQGAYTGLLHCFSSSRQLADKAIEMGLYVSFSGILTFKSAEAVREVARAMPEDRLLVETDAPYLAPVPMRGKRNEPAFVAHTAKRLAELRGTTQAAVEASTTANFHRLFRKVAPA